MQYIEKGEFKLSRLALGNMRIASLEYKEVERLIDTALEIGINLFDHADIYGRGKSEELFGMYLKNHPEKRNKMIIQSKCSIVPGIMYDLSSKHVFEAVDASLKRLNTSYLDIFLLHRPDALCDYKELGDAFDHLYKSGKVKQFGVSNFSSGQIELLKRYCRCSVDYNQLQFSIVHCPSIDEGIHVNMKDEFAQDICGGNVFDYCMLNDIVIQTWSSLQIDLKSGSFINNPDYPKLNEVLDRLARKYNVSKYAISIAWVLRHPANMIPVLGTTKANNLKDLAKSLDVNLTRQEWYELYLASGKTLP